MKTCRKPFQIKILDEIWKGGRGKMMPHHSNDSCEQALVDEEIFQIKTQQSDIVMGAFQIGYFTKK